MYDLAGIGSDHAKFQPGLCWYRMLPEIKLTREVEGEDALLLQKCFSPGVIDITTDSEGKKSGSIIVIWEVSVVHITMNFW